MIFGRGIPLDLVFLCIKFGVNRCFPWPVTDENVKSQSNRLSEPWLNFRNSIGIRVSIIGHLSNDWSWPHTETLQKSEKFQHIHEGLTDIHAKFQHIRMRNAWATIFFCKNAHKLLDNKIHNGNLRVLQYSTVQELAPNQLLVLFLVLFLIS